MATTSTSTSTSTKSSKNSKKLEISTVNSMEDTMNTTVSENNSAKIEFVQKVSYGISDIVFTPENATKLSFTAKSFYALSLCNAIREYISGKTLSAGDGLHIHNVQFSTYDGIRLFYIGNNVAFQAIEDGKRSMTVELMNKKITVKLPASNELVGEWCQARMITDYTAEVVPAKNDTHKNDLTMKHFFLEKMFNGTKIVMFVEPTVWKDGKLHSEASDQAMKLKADILDEQGNMKSAEVVNQQMYEKAALYRDTNKLTNQTKREMKVAQITNMPVAGKIVVNGVETDVANVATGWYRAVNGNGELVMRSIHHIQNSSSVANLQTLATRGLQIQSIEGLL